MEKRYDGRNLRLRRALDVTDAYTKYSVSYRGSGLRISGVLYVPAGDGPFPALVLNHGYIDPDVYVTGQGLQIEQNYLARSGFVVLHTDYRNHAGSDEDPRNGLRLRLGYTEDTINAVKALRRSGLPQVDPDRIGMLGRSMGGGVTLNALVVRPRLVDAAVIYASVSSRTFDNHRKWIRPGRPALAARIERRHGTPKENPRFWREVSPRTYAERVRAPVLVHHGTADDTCPIEWADETVRALKKSGADVTYRRYPGEGHAFSSAWQPSMRRTVAFFREHL
jgi:dipeptidyl aminopeptidase/acylaminoacyl peptidase